MNDMNRREWISGMTAAGVGAAVSQWISNSAEASQAPTLKPRKVTLLHFTDTHGQLETHLEYIPGRIPEITLMGGFARLKTAIERERQRAVGPVFLADGGDEFQGSAPVAWSEGECMVPPLNALGIDVYVPGNWDPAYGPAQFRKLMEALNARVTCFNFYEKETGKRLFDSSVTLERDGVKVVFVGIADILSSTRQPPVQYVGMDTTKMDGLHEFIKQLRRSHQPDLLVLVTHTGITIARQLAREMPEVDVVLSGHTHERTETPLWEGQALVVEPGSMGSFLGRLELTLSPNGGIESHDYQLIPIDAAEYPEDPEVKQMVDALLLPYRERMQEVVGKTQTPLLRYDVLETNADDFITDAIREYASSDLALSNGFRFGLPILAGDLLNSDLWNLLPMDARIKTGWVTGQQIRDYLEHELELVFSRKPMTLSGGWGPRISGMTFRYVAHAPVGKRLANVQVQGKDLQLDRRYTITSCEREGEPLDLVCRMKNTHDVKVLPASLHQALRNYLKSHPLISPRREGRSYAEDLAPVVFSQDAIVTERTRGSYLPTIQTTDTSH